MRSVALQCFTAWSGEILAKQYGAEMEKQAIEMEARLKAAAKSQVLKARKLMARIGAGSQNVMRDICFKEWTKYVEQCKHQKEIDRRIRYAEEKITQFMKDSSSTGKQIMMKVSGSTDTGLLSITIQAWHQHTQEEKRSNELAEIVKGNKIRFALFHERNKRSAQCALSRAFQHQIVMVYVKVWSAWRLFTQIEQLLRAHGMKIDAKRGQLAGVQKMFRNFAVELESTIKGPPDSEFDLSQRPPPGSYRRQKQLAKSEGSHSLPNIHTQDPRFNGEARALHGMHGYSGRQGGWR